MKQKHKLTLEENANRKKIPYLVRTKLYYHYTIRYILLLRHFWNMYSGESLINQQV